MIGQDDPARAVEAVLFAADEPLTIEMIRAHVGADVDIRAALDRVAEHYAGRGIELVRRQVLVVGEAARGIAEGAGDAALVVPDNDAALAWARAELGPGDAVLFKASNGARLYDVAEALL